MPSLSSEILLRASAIALAASSISFVTLLISVSKSKSAVSLCCDPKDALPAFFGGFLAATELGHLPLSRAISGACRSAESWMARTFRL